MSLLKLFKEFWSSFFRKKSQEDSSPIVKKDDIKDINKVDNDPPPLNNDFIKKEENCDSMKSRFIFIIDNGHGGIIDGIYQTPGKRSPIWKDGSQLFEGDFNRDVKSRLMKRPKLKNISMVDLVPELKDISLTKRVDRANVYWNSYRHNPKEIRQMPILISIHANAAGNPNATSWEVWTTKGETSSDGLATKCYEEAGIEFPEFKMRSDYSDKDPDKEANFTIIAKFMGPAFLVENFFMTTYDPDCLLIMSDEGRERIVNYLERTILRIEAEFRK